VIDSPKQQDQDEENLIRMLELVRDFKLNGVQRFLAAVDTNGVKIPGSVIELKSKLHLLQESEYKEAREVVAPLLDLALAD
jgi:hypothetical protein